MCNYELFFLSEFSKVLNVLVCYSFSFSMVIF